MQISENLNIIISMNHQRNKKNGLHRWNQREKLYYIPYSEYRSFLRCQKLY